MSGSKVFRFVGQGVLYLVFATAIGVFSVWPPYQHLQPDEGLLRLSFTHPGKFVTDCRQRSAEELAKIPRQLRADLDCPRERSPVRVRVELDDRMLYDESFAPAGLRRDGASSGYRRLSIPAGEHQLRVQVRDDVRSDEVTFHGERKVNIVPGQVVLIDIIADQGGVVFR
ncbi:MAG: hypothetical protein KJZ83_06025 [Burkholderiaceae bacterium]|nr:hypothetical protein [Burkholderiaceae bacterium]